MSTTTFADVKMTEDFEHRYEKQDYELSKGDIVRIPRHTAGKLVHSWDVAEWAETDNYEVDEKEYDDVVMSVRNSNDESGDEEAEVCGVEKSDGEVCEREKPCKYHSE